GRILVEIIAGNCFAKEFQEHIKLIGIELPELRQAHACSESKAVLCPQNTQRLFVRRRSKRLLFSCTIDESAQPATTPLRNTSESRGNIQGRCVEPTRFRHNNLRLVVI